MTESCYQPICPIGTFLCCVSCGVSSCSLKQDMKYSTRGLRECISCPPGHYCSGCDIPQRCPSNAINPHSGMAKQSDCNACMPGLTASLDQTQCCTNSQRCTEPAEDANYLINTSLDSNGPSAIPIWETTVAIFIFHTVL